MTWRVLLVALALCAAGATAAAQEPPEVPRFDQGQGFLTGFGYHLSLESLSGDDTRFQWDFDAGGELDVMRLDRYRVDFLFNYEGLLGEQLQYFDPIFNNYTIDVLGGAEVSGVELALRLHHISRHLGDRSKPFLIGWNTLGPDATWATRRGANTWQLHGWGGWVFWSSYVDYTGELGGDALYMRTLSSKVALVARGVWVSVFTDDQVSNRGTQTGGRLEGAVRLVGSGAAAEVYVGVDRRVDPDPFDSRPVTWALIGLRLVNR
jgi:hypothetical protein